MKNFNSVTLVGRLAKDVKFKEDGEVEKCSFVVGVDRLDKDEDGSQPKDFFNIVTFGKLADICKGYLAKGSLVLIKGRLQSKCPTYSGRNKGTTEILCESINILEYGKKVKGQD